MSELHVCTVVQEVCAASVQIGQSEEASPCQGHFGHAAHRPTSWLTTGHPAHKGTSACGPMDCWGPRGGIAGCVSCSPVTGHTIMPKVGWSKYSPDHHGAELNQVCPELLLRARVILDGLHSHNPLRSMGSKPRAALLSGTRPCNHMEPGGPWKHMCDAALLVQAARV